MKIVAVSTVSSREAHVKVLCGWRNRKSFSITAPPALTIVGGFPGQGPISTGCPWAVFCDVARIIKTLGMVFLTSRSARLFSAPVPAELKKGTFKSSGSKYTLLPNYIGDLATVFWRSLHLRLNSERKEKMQIHRLFYLWISKAGLFCRHKSTFVRWGAQMNLSLDRVRLVDICDTFLKR